MSEEFEHEEQENDKELNFKKLRQQLKEEKEARERLESQAAERQKAEREAALTQTFGSLGLPQGMIRFYEGEPSEEKVAAWAAEVGLQASTPPPNTGATPEDRLQRLQEAGMAPTESTEQDIQELHADVLSQANKALGELAGLNPFKPTAEEEAAVKATNQRINQLNREAGKQVELGHRRPEAGEFGGPVNPPPYAARFRQAQNS